MGAIASGQHDPAVARAAALIGELSTHKTDEPQFAEPMARLMARLIELVAWTFLGFVCSVAIYYIDLWFFEDPLVASPETGQLYRPAYTDPVVGWTGAIVLAFLLFAIEVIPTALSGRSFGKNWLKLRVVGPDGTAPGLRRASLRFLVWGFPLAVAGTLWSVTFPEPQSAAFMLLGIAVLVVPGSLFRDEHHRGLHDRLAGTTVVAER